MCSRRCYDSCLKIGRWTIVVDISAHLRLHCCRCLASGMRRARRSRVSVGIYEDKAWTLNEEATLKIMTTCLSIFKVARCAVTTRCSSRGHLLAEEARRMCSVDSTHSIDMPPRLEGRQLPVTWGSQLPRLSVLDHLLHIQV